MANEDRRDRIINAAEEVISKKGSLDATITEIARRAKVADSVIYQYFKGKNDLLFSLAHERMAEGLTLLKQHLDGIRDAESLLRKMIWFHLWNNDKHKGYTRILLLECLSKQEFYETEAYRHIREWGRILLDILDKGVEEGAFLPQLDTRLLRDIIIGTLDWETITCLTFGEIDQAVEDLDAIMSLIEPMLSSRKTQVASKEMGLATAAESVFAEKGFNKATIAEIAKRAGVAEGTVYQYFENKEDMLLNVANLRFKSYLEDLTEPVEKAGPERKMRTLIKSHFSVFLTDREFLKIFIMLIVPNQAFYKSKAFQSFRDYFGIIEDVINEGQEKGVFRRDVNPRVFRNMLLGTFNHLGLRWQILGKKSALDKMQQIDQVAELFLSSIT